MKRKSEDWVGGYPLGADSNKIVRRSNKNPTIDHRNEKRNSYISKEEDDLCKNFNITPKNYLNIKEKIIRESIKQGILERDTVSKLFKIERKAIDSIFDFLVEKEDVISRWSDYVNACVINVR